MAEPCGALQICLNNQPIGQLWCAGSLNGFRVYDEYLSLVQRPILSLRCEAEREWDMAGKDGIPPWFGHLLPEGKLHGYYRDRLMPNHRSVLNFRLLAELGSDLPGAVTAEPIDYPDDLPADDKRDWQQITSSRDMMNSRMLDDSLRQRFSLAGVTLKFSYAGTWDRLVVPTNLGATRDSRYILKTPDHNYRQLPLLEHVTMRYAARCGIDVPDTRLVAVDSVEGLAGSFPSDEGDAFVIERFDRTPSGRVHMEDMCQVLGKRPGDDPKYQGPYQAVASVCKAVGGQADLDEFVRRLTFCILVGNNDAHLKNWSLLYRDPQKPQLSPAYDLIPTALLTPGDAELALKLNKSRRLLGRTVHDVATEIRRAGADPERAQHVAVETAATMLCELSHACDQLRDGDAPQYADQLDQYVRSAHHAFRA